MEFWIKDPYVLEDDVGFGNDNSPDPATSEISLPNKFWPEEMGDNRSRIRIKTRNRSASPTSRFNRISVDENQDVSNMDDVIDNSIPETHFQATSSSPKIRSPSPFQQRLATQSSDTMKLTCEGTKENKKGMKKSKSSIARSPSPFHERLAMTTTKATQLRCEGTKENKRIHKSPKPFIPRSPSPCHERLANHTTKSAQFRHSETKESKKTLRSPRPVLPRSPSPLHERLAVHTTKSMKFRFEETKELKKNKLNKPSLPRSPSPLHDRLATHPTKSSQFRYEETREILNSFNRPMKSQMQFYGMSSNPSSLSSNDSEVAPPLVTSNDDSSLLTFSSNSESEELSYTNDQQKARKVSLHVDTAQRLNHFDRLAATNTKTMEMRRQLEKEIQQKKMANRNDHQDRETFYRYPPKSPKMRSSWEVSHRHSSAPPRDGTHGFDKVKTNTQTLTPPHKKSGYSPLKETSVKNSTTSAQLDSFFNRLAKQDTIASSRKTVLTMRPVILTEYEKKEMMEQDRIAKERKKMRTSPRFFDVLSKDMTMSRLYKEYDQTHQRRSSQDESPV